MSYNEEGKKLSEGQYCSLEQVKSIYNKEDVTDIWNRVISYRSNFSYETSLQDTNNNPYFLTLTRTILTKCHNIEIKLMRDLLNFQKLSKEQKNKLLLQQKINALKAVNRFNQGKELNDDLYERIALLSIESLPSSLISLNMYSSAYNVNFFSEGINVEGIEKVNKFMLNDIDALTVDYRKKDIEEEEGLLKVVPYENIKEHINNLINFLKDENIPSLIKSIILVYVFFYLKPFEYLNEESSALLAKSFLASSFLSSTSYLLDFESLSFSKSASVFKKAKECETTLDLTYFVDMALPFFEKEEINLNNKIEELLKEEEFKVNVENVGEVKVEIEQEVALPFFPTNDKNNPASIVEKLKELYPMLKEKQAHFYSTHCTIGLFYTISQFQKEENTVYETARTSMEELAKLGFYRKTKVNKKFVYAPIPKEDINK